ncbi:Dabb family protein [Actinomycetospora sp. TBRC 11914]|uniref:Dabb family protein n=1 Tax=Actinomycetospora sp. TBRC 11914 TaxID=2729387 RepID=UPI00145CFD03|nr:Dabb family protein [Actinomycetospora sp. TBRC 11914]NMO92940.1 Dabb family protein [Actinomycetospora sp. TBRC 11914]
MAVTHVVTFSWVEGTAPETVEDIRTRLQTWIDKGELEGLVAWQAGTDLGLADGNAAFAVSATFTDQDAYERYRDDPEHRSIIAEHIAPRIATRTAVQFAH